MPLASEAKRSTRLGDAQTLRGGERNPIERKLRLSRGNRNWDSWRAAAENRRGKDG